MKKLSIQDHLTWWDPFKTRAKKFIQLYNCFEFLRSVYRIPLKPSKRILCTVQFLKFLIIEGWARILEDFIFIIFGRSLFLNKISFQVWKR